MSVLKFFSLKGWQKEGHLCTGSPPGLWLPEPRGHEASQCYFIVTFSKTGCFVVKLLWLLLFKSMFEIQAISMARRRYAVKYLCKKPCYFINKDKLGDVKIRDG